MEKTAAHSAPSVANDPFAAIRGMDFEQMQAYFWDKRISQRSREKEKPSEYSGCSLGNGLFHSKLILSSCTINGHGSVSS